LGASGEPPGALLRGIGGMGSRIGRRESLYIGGFIGMILIWIGYQYCLQPLDTTNMYPVM